MRERDFILATAAARVEAAQDCLTGVRPTRGAITEREWRVVRRLLGRWREKLFAAIEGEDQPPGKVAPPGSAG